MNKSALTPMQAAILLQIVSENMLVQSEILAKILPSDHPKKAEFLEQSQARFYGIQHIMPFAEQIAAQLKREPDPMCKESAANFEKTAALVADILNKVPDFRLPEKQIH